MKHKGAATALLLAGFGAAALVLPISASASPAPTPQGVAANAATASFPNVTSLSGGWLAYSTNLSSGLTLNNESTTTVTGTMESDGTCDIQASGTGLGR